MSMISRLRQYLLLMEDEPDDHEVWEVIRNILYLKERQKLLDHEQMLLLFKLVEASIDNPKLKTQFLKVIKSKGKTQW